jgi:hypothetical protein
MTGRPVGDPLDERQADRDEPAGPAGATSRRNMSALEATVMKDNALLPENGTVGNCISIHRNWKARQDFKCRYGSAPMCLASLSLQVPAAS